MVRKYPHQFPLPRLLLSSEITIPIHNQTININATTFTSAGAGRNMEETNFDSNMMIILAALLCALICALSLNSIVRCVLRCGRRFPYDDSSDGRRRSGKGVTKDVLRRIPVVAYETGKDVKSATDCAICLTEFEEGERVRVLPECGHGFHVMCIDTWLRSHSSCPTCRQLLSHHSV